MAQVGLNNIKFRERIDFLSRIFRADYGHTEVAAHFGNDPREYCISTKNFVVDEDNMLKGLNTGMF
jgi:hypothetical protein